MATSIFLFFVRMAFFVAAQDSITSYKTVYPQFLSSSLGGLTQIPFQLYPCFKDFDFFEVLCSTASHLVLSNLTFYGLNKLAG